ncbi:MAG: cytochrome d ubiquinol oxidase subunit II [Selenomonadaceae bacterium]|nr:cytochrome d ubiquinol oxidase subunit II [Selenomonadaceae bacterium]
MELTVLWFVLITVLFTGFFILEGFDYGVGILLPFISDRDDDRRMVLRTIGPVWDGNEVWMITAGGALFAAFPHVYATMFSTFYLALFLMLFALILRGVAFELRGRYDSDYWRQNWDRAIFFGSFLPAILWGVAVTDLFRGLPINEHMIYTGGFLNLLSVHSILGGLAFLFVFTYHGASFLTLRLADAGLVNRLRFLAKCSGALAILVFVLFLFMTLPSPAFIEKGMAIALLLGAAVLFVLGYIAMLRGCCKGSFLLSTLAIACTTVSVFVALFPRLMVSSLNPEWSLTITNAASTPYTLSIMTKAALCLVPIVLIYQGWTYWIFRKRVSAEDLKQGH